MTGSSKQVILTKDEEVATWLRQIPRSEVLIKNELMGNGDYIFSTKEVDVFYVRG